MRVLRLSRPQDLPVALRVLRRHALEGNLTVLAGAGISLAGPSALPLSRRVVEAVSQAIAFRLGVLPGILLNHSGEPMRLEPFLRVVAQLCGPAEVERILSILRRDRFNCSHASLAGLVALHLGCSVVCLDFDYLIEEAARSVYALELKPWPPGERAERADTYGNVPFPRLLKPHGMLLKGGGSSGIVATIQKIETYGHDPIWSAMRSMVDRRGLLVTGYSDDDIDVFPCLNATQPSTVLWNTLGEELPRRVGEWLIGLAGSIPVFHLIGPCEKVFGRFPVVRSPPRDAWHAPAVEQHMEAWARGMSVGLLASAWQRCGP